METPGLNSSLFALRPGPSSSFLRKMSTSTSTSTQLTQEIDLQGSQTTINKARQLPLHVVAFKDAFTEATQDIARIAENANPEDPDLLNVEVGAVKVRVPIGVFQVSVALKRCVGAPLRVFRCL